MPLFLKVNNLKNGKFTILIFYYLINIQNLLVPLMEKNDDRNYYS